MPTLLVESDLEISCHARGARSLFPRTRTVIDMGGQDTKAIKVGLAATTGPGRYPVPCYEPEETRR